MHATTIATLASVEADANKKLPDRIHLLRAGRFPTEKYGMLEITADDLQDFARNFKAGYGRPGPDGAKGGLPVNASHNKGGAAAAWINDLEVEGNDLWGTALEWTGFGKSEVEAGNFKYISSEFTPRCLGGAWASAEGLVRDIKNVFTGAALTNIPMFNGNRGIMASAESDGSESNKQLIYINAQAEGTTSMNLDQLRVKENKDLTTEERSFVEAHAADLTAQEKTKFAIVDASAANTAPKTVEASAVTADMGLVSVEASQIVALNDRVKAAEAKVEASEAQKTELQKTVEAHATQLGDMRKATVEASVKEHVARGAIVADQSEKWVTRILADATMEDDLKAIPSNKIVEAANLGEDESGEGGASASSIIDQKAKELVEASQKDGHTPISYGDAVSKVMASNEELANNFEAEQANVNA